MTELTEHKKKILTRYEHLKDSHNRLAKVYKQKIRINFCEAMPEKEAFCIGVISSLLEASGNQLQSALRGNELLDVAEKHFSEERAKTFFNSVEAALFAIDFILEKALSEIHYYFEEIKHDTEYLHFFNKEGWEIERTKND